VPSTSKPLNHSTIPAISRTFAALAYPNFRRWFVGQLFSLIGSWMQATAQGYLIFQLTQSPAYLGYVGFANGIPSWLFTLYGGVIADRVPRRSMLIITQSMMLVLAFILGGLTFVNMVQPWHILILSFLLGIANAFDAPARQAFVVELVDDRNDLTNAIALNATMFNTATIFGPAVGGLVYAWAGPGWCFTINGFSFIAVIIALLLIRLPPFVPQQHYNKALADIRDGLRYVIRDETVRLLIIGLGMVGIFGFGVITLIPAWAVDVLGGDVRTNGLLLSARGIGSLIAALMVAALGYRNIRGKLWTMGSFVMPLMFFFFSLVRRIPLSLGLILLTGLGLMAMTNTTNALVQSHIPDELRGRVMSIYSLVFLGGTPIGALWAGTLAAKLGAPTTVMINAAILLLYAIFIWLRRPQVRELK
jgi:predicted MFS family arabinose efflux permease